MSKPPRVRQRTTNWPAYNASLKRRGSLMVWLDPELAWQAAPSGRAGRLAFFSDAAIQLCLTLKCMFGLGLRQATGLAESLLQLDDAKDEKSVYGRVQAGSGEAGQAAQSEVTLPRFCSQQEVTQCERVKKP